jgi:hypothetical protein
MAGPIIETAREAFDLDVQTAREKLKQKDVDMAVEQRERLQNMMNSGGCCNAAMAAQASREEGTEYR